MIHVIHLLSSLYITRGIVQFHVRAIRMLIIQTNYLFEVEKVFILIVNKGVCTITDSFNRIFNNTHDALFRQNIYLFT